VAITSVETGSGQHGDGPVLSEQLQMLLLVAEEVAETDA